MTITHTHTHTSENLFYHKSNLPGECLTPSCHHRQKGGNDHAVLFSLISRLGEPLIWKSAFKAAGSVCAAQETERGVDGSPRQCGSS